MNTHLDHRSDDVERLASAEEIQMQLDTSEKMPVIICGDFNDTPESKMYDKMATRFEDSWKKTGKGVGYTIPNPKVNKRIDFIWYLRSIPVIPIKSEVLSSLASDHLPVITEFQIP